jgi:hypothetical protein
MCVAHVKIFVKLESVKHIEHSCHQFLTHNTYSCASILACTDMLRNCISGRHVLYSTPEYNGNPKKHLVSIKCCNA